MADDNNTLVILLEQVLSSKLKNQIVTAEFFTDSTDAFIVFVQILENRHLYLMGPTGSGRNPIVPLLCTTIQSLNPVNCTPAPSLNAIIRSAVSVTTMPTRDSMDLSSQRYTNRRERGECFCYRSIDHHMKDCPFSDNRPVQVRASLINPAPLSLVPSSAQIQLYAISLYNLSSPGSSSSGNGARLI
ncbi:hypothetical protein OCU04_001373 [Sclerotinia nivalis]|uniref:Uncharacterized protein n=1 Tax=Sclerotinia nivalis TaxID=352851 RepID=A0A9X0DQL6_9HELO|nr:hypothetical protein OCU04_001373 [Sclerotinia nivalis]